MELLAQQQMKYVRKESSSKAEKPRNHPPDTKQNFSVEESIADLEKEVTRLESQMAEESNVEELMNLQVEKDQLNEKIEELYEQWMEE